MPTGTGFDSICGVGAESTWGTVVAATQKLGFLGDSLDEVYTQLPNEALLGVGSRPASKQGARSPAGGFSAHLDYGLQDVVLTHFFGQWSDEATPPPQDHYDMLDRLDAKGLSVAIERSVSVHEYTGFKGNEFTLTGNPGDGVSYTLNGFAKSRDLSSVTNTTAVLAALGEPAARVLFHHLTLRIGDMADILAAGDNVNVSDFTLTINRNREPTIVNSQDPLEALENGLRDGSLAITIPRYEADTFLAWHAAHTVLQAQLHFTDGTNNKWFNLPQLTVVSCPVPTGGPGFLPITATMALHNNIDNANTYDDSTNSNWLTDQEIQLFEN